MSHTLGRTTVYLSLHRVEGTVVGTIPAGHLVLVAKGGTVEGDIHAQEAILDGEVNGSILADGRVDVQAEAVIHGDIKTPCLTATDVTLSLRSHESRVDIPSRPSNAQGSPIPTRSAWNRGSPRTKSKNGRLALPHLMVYLPCRPCPTSSLDFPLPSPIATGLGASSARAGWRPSTWRRT